MTIKDDPLDRAFPPDEKTLLLDNILIELEGIHSELNKANKYLGVIGQVMVKYMEKGNDEQSKPTDKRSKKSSKGT